MTEDEREAFAERVAICVESGVPEEQARRIARAQLEAMRKRSTESNREGFSQKKA